METQGKYDRQIARVFALCVPLVCSYFIFAIASIDYVLFAYAYSELAPIFIGIYGVFLAFMSAALLLSRKETSITSRLVSWVVGVLQVWAIISTSEAFVRLKAALNSPVIDTFEISTQTGAIMGAFLFAVMSFLIGMSIHAMGGLETWMRLASSSRRES
jgi:hypothetical protein